MSCVNMPLVYFGAIPMVRELSLLGGLGRLTCKTSGLDLVFRASSLTPSPTLLRLFVHSDFCLWPILVFYIFLDILVFCLCFQVYWYKIVHQILF